MLQNRAQRVIVLLVGCLALAAAGDAQAADPVVAAAGDIACDPADPNYNGGAGTSTACRMRATSDLLVGLAGSGLAGVLLLGDNQYENGTLAAYQASFDPTWGRIKALTYPAPGNHEYNSAGAAGYYAYFGAAAGDPAKGWYSFDLGGWHLIVLNSNCAALAASGGCGAGSAEERWLAADLAAHPGVCTLAYWHHPRFSSGAHGDDPASGAFWADLYAAGVDLVLNGHDHDFERFAPQDPTGAAAPARGIRELVVGTGGKNQTAFATVQPNSQARSSGAFGVLELTLHRNSYDWRFLPAAGGAFADSGTALCHASGPTSFYTLPPCRVIDTRTSAGGPALAGGATRDVAVAGLCGVPATALAVAGNVTVAAAGGSGDLRLFPAGPGGPAAENLPSTSTINFSRGQTRANNTVLGLGVAGQVAVHCDLPAGPAGTVNFILDVAGYFE